MAESTLSLTYESMLNAACWQLGWGRSYAAADPVKKQPIIVECVQSGYRQFLYNAVVGDQKVPYEWSWLRVTKDSHTVFGSLVPPGETPGTLNFPDDFGGIVGEFVIVSTTGNHRIPVIPKETVESLRQRDTTAGTPTVAAVYPVVGSTGGTGAAAVTRWKAIFHPYLAAGCSVSYVYNLLPQALSATQLPLGGMAHAETILESVLSVCEQRMDDEETVHLSRYARLLAASIELDKRTAASTSLHAWPVTTDEATLEGIYSYLQRQVGRAAGYGPNKLEWTRVQEGDIDDFIQVGWRRLCSAHDWTFLKPSTTLNTSSGSPAVAADMVDLPSGFGGVEGAFYFAVDLGCDPVINVGEAKVLELQRGSPQSGPPHYFGIRPKAAPTGSATQAFEVLFWPFPDAIYVLTYRYRLVPHKLTATYKFPLGGEFLSDAILESCLYGVELANNVAQGPHWQAYQAALQRAIEHDGKAITAERLGYCGDASIDGSDVSRNRSAGTSYEGTFY